MRKLKLQVFMSIDGFIAGLEGTAPDEQPEAEKPSANEPDEKLDQYIDGTISTSDTILLGRKMAGGFVTYWEDVVNNQPNSPEYPLAKKLVDTPKIVFSKTLTESTWNNTTLETGDLATAVNALKAKAGKDIIVYGGGGFVSSLIKADLIDEYHLFINPHALGQGMPIFHKLTKQFNLKLKSASAFKNDIALLVYERK
ncbi:MAG: dihydrofolate reductase family protein [Chloroflexi bacterium]|nr:dihydrofolate reductase family protein [Chloroflexota bacterium]MCC6892839.1 dihydrofolate reductase family protein [Anaerolineae bacterium]